MKRYLTNLWRALLGKPYREERWYLVETEDDAVLVFDDGDRQEVAVAFTHGTFDALLADTGVRPVRWRAREDAVHRTDGETVRASEGAVVHILASRKPASRKPPKDKVTA